MAISRTKIVALFIIVACSSGLVIFSFLGLVQDAENAEKLPPPLVSYRAESHVMNITARTNSSIGFHCFPQENISITFNVTHFTGVYYGMALFLLNSTNFQQFTKFESFSCLHEELHLNQTTFSKTFEHDDYYRIVINNTNDANITVALGLSFSKPLPTSSNGTPIRWIALTLIGFSIMIGMPILLYGQQLSIMLSTNSTKVKVKPILSRGKRYHDRKLYGKAYLTLSKFEGKLNQVFSVKSTTWNKSKFEKIRENCQELLALARTRLSNTLKTWGKTLNNDIQDFLDNMKSESFRNKCLQVIEKSDHFLSELGSFPMKQDFLKEKLKIEKLKNSAVVRKWVHYHEEQISELKTLIENGEVLKAVEKGRQHEEALSKDKDNKIIRAFMSDVSVLIEIPLVNLREQEYASLLDELIHHKSTAKLKVAIGKFGRFLASLKEHDDIKAIKDLVRRSENRIQVYKVELFKGIIKDKYLSLLDGAYALVLEKSFKEAHDACRKAMIYVKNIYADRDTTLHVRIKNYDLLILDFEREHEGNLMKLKGDEAFNDGDHVAALQHYKNARAKFMEISRKYMNKKKKLLNDLDFCIRKINLNGLKKSHVSSFSIT